MYLCRMKVVDVPYFYGYCVAENGDVFRKETGELMKKYLQKSGYVSVYLRRGKCTIAVPVHRIVCMAFHGVDGYLKGLFVDHIDTDRANNSADNLRWVTQKENMNNVNTLAKKRLKNHP